MSQVCNVSLVCLAMHSLNLTPKKEKYKSLSLLFPSVNIVLPPVT